MRGSADLDTWLGKVADLLAGNRITVNGHRYTAPSLDTGDFGRQDYANQFMWDSCFHAIIWRWIDPQMAQDELISLVSRQLTDGMDAGMIPHCNYWRGGGDWLWRSAEHSSITQPPMVAIAAARVYERSRDRAFLATVYPKLCAYHDWFDRRRDPDQDNLVCLVHPWESGGDALPRWDGGMKLHSFSHEGGRTARLELAKDVEKYESNPLALAKHGWFHVEPMDFNAIRAADMEALAEIARALEKPEEAVAWGQRAAAVRDAFQHKMVIDGLPYDLEGLDERPIIQDSAGQLVTLFGGCLTDEQAERLVERLGEKRFWTMFPVPTSPTDAPTYAPDTYWRGNVWPCTNWFIGEGLRRSGHHDLAGGLAEHNLALLEKSGFWEYYHPETGQGLGGKDFSWATVLLDLPLSLTRQ